MIHVLVAGPLSPMIPPFLTVPNRSHAILALAESGGWRRQIRVDRRGSPARSAAEEGDRRALRSKVDLTTPGGSAPRPHNGFAGVPASFNGRIAAAGDVTGGTPV